MAISGCSDCSCQGAVPVIVKVPNQPTNYNNFQPSYLSDGSIVFITADKQLVRAKGLADRKLTALA